MPDVEVCTRAGKQWPERRFDVQPSSLSRRHLAADGFAHSGPGSPAPAPRGPRTRPAATRSGQPADDAEARRARGTPAARACAGSARRPAHGRASSGHSSARGAARARIGAASPPRQRSSPRRERAVVAGPSTPGRARPRAALESLGIVEPRRAPSLAAPSRPRAEQCRRAERLVRARERFLVPVMETEDQRLHGVVSAERPRVPERPLCQHRRASGRRSPRPPRSPRQPARPGRRFTPDRAVERTHARSWQREHRAEAPGTVCWPGRTPAPCETPSCSARAARSRDRSPSSAWSVPSSPSASR